MTPNTQGASWKDGLKERLFIVTRDLKITLEDFDFITEYLEEVISKERAEGERRGAERAVEYISNQIEAFMDLETVRFGADTTVEELEQIFATARTLPADSTEV